MTTLTPEQRDLRLPCDFRWPVGTPCLAFEDHAVHHGRWSGPELNHEFHGFDRRKADRRALLSPDTGETPEERTPPGDGLDVERLARAIGLVKGVEPKIGGAIYWDHAGKIAAEYARLAATRAPRPKPALPPADPRLVRNR